MKEFLNKIKSGKVMMCENCHGIDDDPRFRYSVSCKCNNMPKIPVDDNSLTILINWIINELEREVVDNCLKCGSTKIDSGEFWFRYHNDRHLICHSCGFELDNATAGEIERDNIAKEEYWNEINADIKENRRLEYEKLKAEFEVI